MVVRKLIQISGLTLAILFTLALFAAKAHAATFTVDSTDDGANTGGPGVCDDGGGKCTFRAAIQAANATAGADIINFNIPGGDVLQTITPASDYDQITEQVTIDGSTQTGASCGTLVPASLPANSNTPHVLRVEIDASGAGLGGGITLGTGSDSSIVRGLILNNSQGRPEVQVNANSITVECNYVGTNSVGTAAGASNTDAGVVVNGDSNIVQNNLVSGNVGTGVSADGLSLATVVANNLIGTTANGLSALANTAQGVAATGLASVNHSVVSGNTTDGVFIANTNNAVTGNYIGLNMAGSVLGNGGSGILTDNGINNYTIGGSGAGEGNVISANASNGITIKSVSGDNCPVNFVSHTFGNKIGTNTSGSVQTGFGNGGSGVSANETVGSSCIQSVYKHQIGGDNTGEPNIIAGNAQDGVRVFEYNNLVGDHTDVFSISILTNSIFANGNLGINLASASDSTGPADVDLGPNAINSFVIDYPASHANNYLNRPTINSVSTSGNNATVNYDFQAPPGITENSPALLAADLVGYRLDFYLNSAGQDGAYSGQSQGKTHLGSFIVNGSESGATHTFTSPIPLTGSQTVTTTATILWQVVTCESSGNVQQGNGPPYGGCGD